MVSPLENGKNQGLFKALKYIFSTLQIRYSFQENPLYSSSFQDCEFAWFDSLLPSQHFSVMSQQTSL